MKKGQSAEILEILDCIYKDKLMEMGCVPGVTIVMTMKAPFGDPLGYDLEGYTLSMRKSEASNVVVKLLAD
ncbi:MAG: ferrous iron transport protein A [Bacteroidia bacterium]